MIPSDFNSFEITIKYQGTKVTIKTQCEDFEDLVDIIRAATTAIGYSDELWKQALHEQQHSQVSEDLS